MKCKKCNGELKEGVALLNTLITNDGRFSSQACRGETMTRIGSPNLVSCLKCVDCGHSFVEENKPTSFNEWNMKNAIDEMLTINQI